MRDFGFRTLFEELRAASEPLSGVLKRRQAEALTLINRLARLGLPEAVHWKMQRRADDYQVSFDDIWELYALSRISDFLLLPFQQGAFASYHPDITLDERNEFWLSMQMQRIIATEFNPFYHEIVEVSQTEDPSAPITLREEIWPGFMLGHMLFCRAGVKVSAGSDHAVKEIAERSTLYFAYRRRNRPCQDLSMGWGSNSQWRTDFRRDYAIDGTYYYNVDGKWDVRELAPREGPGNGEPTRNEISEEERIELLTHRCFVRTAKPHNDLWPYNDYFVDRGQHA